MSKISTVYDAIVTLIEGSLTGYEKLPNAYDNTDNNELYLTKGYGVAFSAAQNTERFTGCRKASTRREFSVFLTRLIDVTAHDTTGHATLEKSLMEDLFLLVKAIEVDPDLGGAAANAKYEADGGIEILEGDRSKYLFIEAAFSAEYIDNL